MKLSDLPVIMEVERASFPTPWPRQAFYNELIHNRFARYSVVQVDGRVVGYCGLWLLLDEAHITNIAIHPNFRGRGLGEALLSYVMRRAKEWGAGENDPGSEGLQYDCPAAVQENGLRAFGNPPPLLHRQSGRCHYHVGDVAWKRRRKTRKPPIKGKCLVLGIETSCDETSAAVVADGKELLSNVISSQMDLHRRFGGVVPEVASRRHVERITAILQEALDRAGVGLKDLSAVAVTQGPGLVGALLIGVSAAKALSFATGIPLVAVHHIAGTYLRQPARGAPTFSSGVAGRFRGPYRADLHARPQPV